MTRVRDFLMSIFYPDSMIDRPDNRVIEYRRVLTLFAVVAFALILSAVL